MLAMVVLIPTTFLSLLWFVTKRASKKADTESYDPGDGRVRWQ
ncbi:MAG: hypothetical protein AAF368_11865 [Planctomycetota bacterium]